MSQTQYRGTILLVDDEMSRVADRMYSEKGFLLVGYTDGAKAIRDVDRGLMYDLGVVDFSLKNQAMDGLGVIRELLARHPSIPLVSSSAWDYKIPEVRAHHDKVTGSEGLFEIIDTFFK